MSKDMEGQLRHELGQEKEERIHDSEAAIMPFPEQRNVHGETQAEVDAQSQNAEETMSEKRTIFRAFSYNYKLSHPEKKRYARWETMVLAYQTLGVVYGDVGTSPLYVFSSIDQKLEGEKDFLGVLSIIFWTITLIAVFKYVFIVLRSDDHGEGGTFAVYSLLCQNAKISPNAGKQYSHMESDTKLKYFSKQRNRFINSKTLQLLENSLSLQKLLLLLVMIGTCMVIGDGVLTPAISVLSAIVGIKSQNSEISQSAVIAVSSAIIVLLFFFQRFGTGGVSFLFSPIMIAWFLSTALVGIYNIATFYPGVFKALSPHYILLFFIRYKKRAWVMLGATVLCITGVEAMFADLGHFNRQSIQLAFTTVVYPSLILTYSGEAAYLIKNPMDLDDTFFKSIPKPVFWPMFIIATLAAIVASQALISATFSIIKQSMALGCFPRVKIIHTSKQLEGQVYSPEVCYTLMVLCLAVILGFRSGTQIGNAFGVAVIWVMLITTFMVTLVMLVVWMLPLPIVFAFFCFFGLIEGIYMTAVLNKVPQGGWVPFAISCLFLVIMLSWNYGRQKKYEYEMHNQIPAQQLGELISDATIARVPGVCFFYSDLVHGLPPIVGHYVRNVGSLHQVLLFVTVRHIPVTTVLAEERFLFDTLGFIGVYRCIVRYGYMDAMDSGGGEFLNQMISGLKAHITESSTDSIAGLPNGDVQLDVETLSGVTNAGVLDVVAMRGNGAVFVIGKAILKANTNAKWYEQLIIDKVFRFLSDNCRTAMTTLCLPPSQSLQVGMLYEI